MKNIVFYLVVLGVNYALAETSTPRHEGQDEWKSFVRYPQPSSRSRSISYPTVEPHRIIYSGLKSVGVHNLTPGEDMPEFTADYQYLEGGAFKFRLSVPSASLSLTYNDYVRRQLQVNCEADSSGSGSQSMFACLRLRHRNESTRAYHIHVEELANMDDPGFSNAVCHGHTYTGEFRTVQPCDADQNSNAIRDVRFHLFVGKGSCKPSRFLGDPLPEKFDERQIIAHSAKHGPRGAIITSFLGVPELSCEVCRKQKARSSSFKVRCTARRLSGVTAWRTHIEGGREVRSPFVFVTRPRVQPSESWFQVVYNSSALSCSSGGSTHEIMGAKRGSFKIRFDCSQAVFVPEKQYGDRGGDNLRVLAHNSWGTSVVTPSITGSETLCQ